MDLLGGFDQGLDEFGRRVRQVRAEQWDSPTPCADWSVRDLVGHVTVEHLWAPWLLKGAALDEVGDRFEGDVLGEDPVAAWESAAAASRGAAHRPGALDAPVHTSAGLTPADEYLRQMTLDLAAHSWDLARGIEADDRLDPDLVALAYGYAETQVDGWQDMGIFAPPVPVSEAAPRQDRLVALLGRQP
ncbi:TIGR03086 family metal-binding protein [Streptomyces litchfieldiae]|uniref:TIGR03086 family metal-binding protein n=1 Tax=Streptomyces litchfieldiae TaxID=3075543 RepID=A0ABU2N2T0_9ACTN|nr:TIGR03086 family metal-binding protein [Streptomyces sp. DSM 44938]MDT0347348.1 TIGR03086 family metal-binding protein [Streptomyces sp. DSM 44938]